MAAGGLVVNVARGGVIERSALVSLLKSRHLAGAAMDVFWKEPFDPQDADQGGVTQMRTLQAQVATAARTHSIYIILYIYINTEREREREREGESERDRERQSE
jgi:hypothetical protein